MLHSIIEDAYEPVWRRVLGRDPKPNLNPNPNPNPYPADYKCQLSYIESMKVDMGSAFKDPRNEVCNDHGKGERTPT